MVGESTSLRQVWDAIKRAAPTNATVLLLGESGVGKELVARSIHRNSLRSRERFVQVNCAAIPEELIESELFGHEKGSFTGATEKQIGKFEQADRGTIFLDEVGDMSAKTQAKVLRVLQEGEVERLGSARTIKVDVRVIAATNKDLEQEIEKGNFREDLYFRLSVIPIRVPPLRDRREDVPALVRHFADLFSRDNNRRAAAVHAGTRSSYLQKARWKGNVRELKNTVERLIIMSPGTEDRRGRSARGGAAGSAARGGGEREGTARYAARVQGIRRACVPGRQAAREQLEHLEDGGSHRHAAQQPVQEARAVRHQSGRRTDNRIAAAADQTTARLAPARAEARGKSELRRAVRRVTPGQGDLKDSGTENIPPLRSPSEAGPRRRSKDDREPARCSARRARRRKGEKVR